MPKRVLLLLAVVLLAGCINDGQTAGAGEKTTHTLKPTSTSKAAAPTATTPPTTLPGRIEVQVASDEKVEAPRVTMPGPEKIEVLSFSTGRATYHSGELMNITALVRGNMPVANVSVRVYGIKVGAVREYYKLDRTFSADVRGEETEVSLPYMTPPCTGCAGISPGNYTIQADFSLKGRLLASSTLSVEILQ